MQHARAVNVASHLCMAFGCSCPDNNYSRVVILLCTRQRHKTIPYIDWFNSMNTFLSVKLWKYKEVKLL